MSEEQGMANKRIGGFSGIVPLVESQHQIRKYFGVATYTISSTMMMTQAKLKFQWNQSS
jgi:hypothetical protein